VVDPFVDQICEAICGSLRAHVDRQAQRLPRVSTNGDLVGTSPTPTRITSRRATNRRRRT
jgi:hypothetical protein